MGEGSEYDFDDDIANEITSYALDLIEDFPEETKSEIILDALIHALSKAMLGHRILNPQITHRKLIDQVFYKLREQFHKRAGAEDFCKTPDELMN